MTSKNATVLFICGLIVSFVWPYVTINRAENWIGSYWGFVGTNVGIISALYTLFQLYQIRKESVLISETSKQTRELIYGINHYGDLAKAIKIVHEVQSLSRGKKYEPAVMRLQDLKIILGHVRVLQTNAARIVNFDEHLKAINFIIGSLEKEIDTKTDSLSVSQVNSKLEPLSDALVSIQAQILHRK
jgi:hypothetical protein